MILSRCQPRRHRMRVHGFRANRSAGSTTGGHPGATGVGTDPKPPGFLPSSGHIEGCPEKLRYETGTDRRSRNKPKSRRPLTYEWDTKGGRTTELSSPTEDIAATS